MGGQRIPVASEFSVISDIDCVIDKDATASLLALQIVADFFLILTGGDRIFVNLGQPNQTKLEKISKTELV